MVVVVQEERVTITNDIKIGATIAYSNKNEKRPFVLLIMGTGNLDRDGNGKGFQSNLYKNMSDMFVNMGCVCIRYDKRGTHESSGSHKTSGLYDLVNDAINVIHYARKLEYVDEGKVIICGHSEGTQIATIIAEKEEVQGLILLCGACMGMKEALMYQNMMAYDQVQTMDGFKGWILKKTLDKEKLKKQVDGIFSKAEKSKKDMLFYRGAFLNTKYFKEHNEYTSEKYAQIIKDYPGKTLAITGKADVQADYKQLEKIASFDGVTVYTPEKVNHILREIDDDNLILDVKKQYKRLLKNDIDEGVKEQITQWINNF